jgi:nucleoside-diphosphate-sugar epimerase
MEIHTVAITGGNGRIGRATVEELNDCGYRTINLDRQDKFGTEGARERAEQVADEYLTVDLLDPGSVYGALGSSDADAVVHLGTIRAPANHPGHVTYENNVMTSYNVLEAATELGLDAVAMASSLNAIGSVYQTTESIFSVGAPVEIEYLPVDEEHPRTPRDPYAIAKHALEITADGFGRLEAPPTAISTLRFPWVLYTEEMREILAGADRSIEAIRDPSPEMAEYMPATTRDVLFSYLHVKDAAAIARRAVEADFEGHETFWAVADDTTAEAPSAEIAAEFYPDAEVRADLDGTQSLVDTTKAEELLGWEPAHSWRDL